MKKHHQSNPSHLKNCTILIPFPQLSYICELEAGQLGMNKGQNFTKDSHDMKIPEQKHMTLVDV